MSSTAIGSSSSTPEEIRTDRVGYAAEQEERAGSMPDYKEFGTLFKATGLLEIFSAKGINEFLTDPTNMKNYESFRSAYESAGNYLSNFDEFFQDFSEDQVAKKGYFSPNEAYEDWRSFVEEQNATAKQMKGVANSLAAPAPKQATLAASPPPPEKSGGSESVTAAKKTAAPESSGSPLEYFNKLIDMIMKMSNTMSELAMIQSQQLQVETARQEIYLQIQKDLKSVTTGVGYFKKPDGDTARDNVDNWNKYILPNLQEQNRSYKEQSQERSKQINANINRTVDIIKKLSDDFSDLLSKLTSAAMSIIR